MAWTLASGPDSFPASQGAVWQDDSCYPNSRQAWLHLLIPTPFKKAIELLAHFTGQDLKARHLGKVTQYQDTPWTCL